MGGAISGCFAALYPELVSHLTLCCPASMHLLTLYLIFKGTHTISKKLR